MGLFKSFTNKMLHEENNQEAEQQELAKTVGEMWDWLRRSLDTGCEIYLKTGSDEHLKACLTGNAYKDVIEYLNQLRYNNIIWEYPERDARADTQIVVEGSDDVRTHYVITEYFNDYSRLEFYQNGQLAAEKQASGEQKILRATIQTDQDGNYYIADVAMKDAL